METYITIRMLNPAQEGMATFLTDYLREMQQHDISPSNALKLLDRKEGKRRQSKDLFNNAAPCALEGLDFDLEREQSELRVVRGAAIADALGTAMAERGEYMSRPGLMKMLRNQCGLQDSEIDAAWELFHQLQREKVERSMSEQYKQMSAAGV